MFRFLLAALLLAATTHAKVGKPICGGSTSSKDIQLTTQKNPPRECVYHINAYSSYVCQLRIDWSMTLAQPTIPTIDNGLKHAKCLDDYFEAGGVRLCGVETQQHIYVPFNRTAGVTNVDLKFVLAARTGWSILPEPEWNMRVTQLECPAGASVRQYEETLKPEARATIKDGFFVAPPGCLQYFPHDVGAFTSFNFNNGYGIYPGELNYAICFRRKQYTRALDLTAHFFKLGSDSMEFNRMGYDDQCHPQFAAREVDEDFLVIPLATVVGTNRLATYYCGNSPGTLQVQSIHPGPLMLIFNSNGVLRHSNAGFAFSYSLLK